MSGVTQYDATVVGGLRCQITDINISYPPSGTPGICISQQYAVTMNDGTTQLLTPMNQVTMTLNPAVDGNTPVQMVDFNTGVALTGQFTTLNEVMLKVLAIARMYQAQENP